MTAAEPHAYGTAEHAATEALTLSGLAHDGYVSGYRADEVAAAVVAGLRERGFQVSRGPLCECGWMGGGTSHQHDARLGKASS